MIVDLKMLDLKKGLWKIGVKILVFCAVCFVPSDFFLLLPVGFCFFFIGEKEV